MLIAVQPPRTSLSGIDLAGVGLYLLATLAIIVWSSRKQATTEEYFLGGRRMPWLAVGMSLLATLLSSISYLAVPGEMVRNGIAMFSGYLAIPVSAVVVLFVWAPFFMRLRMTSAYEYLERRFNYTARLLASVLFLLLRLGWMSTVVYTASLALNAMTSSLVPGDLADPLAGWWRGEGAEAVPLLRDTWTLWIVGMVGVAATLYACFGGLRAAVYNDVLQFVMLFGGTLVTLAYVAWATGTGPVGWWQTVADQTQQTQVQWFPSDLTTRATVVTAMMYTFFWTICTHSSDQVVLQRYFATQSLSAARRSYLVGEISNIAIGVLLALSGLALLSFYLQHRAYLPAGASPQDIGDAVLPHFFAHQLPAGLGGLILAGFLCDAMQTLVSGVNSITAVATKDALDRLPAQRQRWLSDVALARLMTVGLGIVVTGVALTVSFSAASAAGPAERLKRADADGDGRVTRDEAGPRLAAALDAIDADADGTIDEREFTQAAAARRGRNLYDLMPRLFNMFLGPLASLFAIGMFLPRATARSAIPAVVAGFLLSLTWSYWPEIPAACRALGLEEAAGWFVNLLGTVEQPKAPTFTLSIAIPYLGAIVLAALLSVLVERGSDHPGRAYTWYAVTRRPLPQPGDAPPVS
jgi:SSS family solute:Na+ symporter